MSNANKDLMQRWFDQVWNDGNSAAIDEMVTDDLVIHGLTDAQGKDITGVSNFNSFHAQFRSAFPNIVVAIEDVIAEGDRVVARCRVSAKHTGDALGLAPTNADVSFTGIAIARIENGRIAEAWNNFDFMKMNQQLGIL